MYRQCGCLVVIVTWRELTSGHHQGYIVVWGVCFAHVGNDELNKMYDVNGIKTRMYTFILNLTLPTYFVVMIYAIYSVLYANNFTKLYYICYYFTFILLLSAMVNSIEERGMVDSERQSFL